MIMTYIRNFKNIGVVTAVGVFGWFTGTLNERYKNNFLTNFDESENKPGLPVFGTVSAAAPFVPDKSGNRFALVQNRTTEIMKYGFPSLENVRSYDDFVLSFDRRTRVANWVFEHLSQERLKYNDKIDRSKCEFTEDMSVHSYFRANNKDYLKSGFDRGHLAAAGNHRVDQKHVEQTFFLSNIAPQIGVGFNRDAWNSLEKHVRRLTKTYANVFVCTGPLYLPMREANGKYYVKYQVIGTNQVAVPTHFFKVVVMETKDNKLHMEAYVMPNQVINSDFTLTEFQVSPEFIERNAGLLFFDRLSREKLVQVNGRKTTFI